MMKRPFLLTLAAACLSSAVPAADVAGQIASLRLRENGSGVIRIRGDNCNSANSGWGFVFDVNTAAGRAYYDLVLLALQNRSAVRVTVRSCDNDGDKPITVLTLVN